MLRFLFSALIVILLSSCKFCAAQRRPSCGVLSTTKQALLSETRRSLSQIAVFVQSPTPRQATADSMR